MATTAYGNDASVTNRNSKTLKKKIKPTSSQILDFRLVPILTLNVA